MSSLLPGAGEHEVLAGRWALEVPLGMGGFASVWRARDLRLGRRVAVKRLLRPSPTSLARFQREVQVLAGLRHPNVVTLLDAGSDAEGLPFLVMEWVPGRTVAELAEERPLEPEHAARVVRDAALGVAAAHAQQVLHRDLKPHNVLVEDADGRGRVVDFGLALLGGDAARLTAPGGSPGTLSFMAPEQISAEQPPSPAVDVYGLGATLYYALTGEPPFAAESALALAAQILERAPRPPRELRPGLDPELEALVLECLEKDPARRPRDAGRVARRLERCLEDLTPPPLDVVPADAPAPDAWEAEPEPTPPPWRVLGAFATARPGGWPIDPGSAVRAALAVAAIVVIVKVARWAVAHVESVTPPPHPAVAGAPARAEPAPSDAPSPPSAPSPPTPPPPQPAPPPAPERPAPQPAPSPAPERPAPLTAAAARALLQEGQVRPALEGLTAALERRPDDAELLVLRGDARARAGDAAGAEVDYRTATSRDPERVEAWAGLARMLLNRGDGGGAATAAARATTLEPERAELHVLCGQGRLLQGDPRQAERCFSRALELDPRARAAWRGRADAWKKLGQPERADEDMEALHALPAEGAPGAAPSPTAAGGLPGDWPLLLARGLALPPPPHDVSFQAAWGAQEPDRLQAQARDWRGWTHLGHALAARGRWSAALDAYDKALRDEPGRPEPRLARADALLVAGQVPAALEEYERALAAGPLPAARRGRALALGRLGRLDEAEAELESAGEAELKRPAALAVRAWLHQLRGDLEGAGEDLQRALTLGGSRSPALQRTLAGLRLQAGDVAGARAAIDASLRLLPEEPDAVLVLAVVELAEGDRAHARQSCEWLLERSVRADARLVRGLLLALEGDLEGARSDVRRALARPEEAPPEAFAARALLCQAEGGQVDPADRARLLEARPGHPAARLLRAR